MENNNIYTIVLSRINGINSNNYVFTTWENTEEELGATMMSYGSKEEDTMVSSVVRTYSYFKNGTIVAQLLIKYLFKHYGRVIYKIDNLSDIDEFMGKMNCEIASLYPNVDSNIEQRRQFFIKLLGGNYEDSFYEKYNLSHDFIQSLRLRFDFADASKDNLEIIQLLYNYGLLDGFKNAAFSFHKGKMFFYFNPLINGSENKLNLDEIKNANYEYKIGTSNKIEKNFIDNEETIILNDDGNIFKATKNTNLIDYSCCIEAYTVGTITWLTIISNLSQQLENMR